MSYLTWAGIGRLPAQPPDWGECTGISVSVPIRRAWAEHWPVHGTYICVGPWASCVSVPRESNQLLCKRQRVCVCVCAARACVSACARACVCVRACVRVGWGCGMGIKWLHVFFCVYRFCVSVGRGVFKRLHWLMFYICDWMELQQLETDRQKLREPQRETDRQTLRQTDR